MFFKLKYFWLLPGLILLLFACNKKVNEEQSSKKVILTFDDAVKSHLNYVAPLLHELEFPATFFVTYAFMDDQDHFLSWEEIARLDSMGFEIGNHSWTHPDFGQPVNAEKLAGELGLINYQLGLAGVKKPVSFAWTGNGFGPEAVKVLQEQGIVYARRGMQPEIPYGSKKPGPGYDPEIHHPLLIPTTRDFYPDITFKDFKAALEQAKKDEIVVLQFHGVPDITHPWVHTDPGLFKECMLYLKDQEYEVLAMRDLEQYLPDNLPQDSLLSYRHVLGDPKQVRWPQEVIASRSKAEFWIPNMIAHGFSVSEMSEVLLWPEDVIHNLIETRNLKVLTESPDRIQILPYPGGRHPRIGFKDGMLSPMRGTKASIFLPWDPGKYIVLDLPEAIFSQFGLHFLGHTHIPTVFDIKREKIVNTDWKVHEDGTLSNQWNLPDTFTIGAEIIPGKEDVNLELWVYNAKKDTILTDLQTQICIMLKGADDYSIQSNDNKVMNPVSIAVESSGNNPWIITAWDRCSHVWGNEACPCMHADPKFPDCKPGDTVRLTGKIWFYEGAEIKNEMNKAEIFFTSVEK